VALIAGVLPAAGQRFSRRKHHVGFAVELGILELLAGVDPANHVRAKRINELLQIEDLHEAAVIVMLDFQKHRQARDRSMLIRRQAVQVPPLPV
jgi:hypothetical protein